MKYAGIQKDMRHLCRNCLNEKHAIGLQPKDCIYAMYPEMCCRCGQMKNIVSEIRFYKRLKIRLTLAPRRRS